MSKSNNQSTPHPFIKWVGGKRSILNILLERIPKNYNRYIEPFLGGGALFFASQSNNLFFVSEPREVWLSDINKRLISTYKAVRDNPQEVIELLKEHFMHHNKDYYYSVRETFSTETNDTKMASLFIYLNKTCFNALYRVNKNGDFNVPMGDYKKTPFVVDENNLYAVSRALKNSRIINCSFELINVQSNDFVYLDPPYHNTYDSYSSGGFNEDYQMMLLNFCYAADKKGALFMQSNSDTPFIRELYKDYNIEEVFARRSVSRNADQRKKEQELLIRNY